MVSRFIKNIKIINELLLLKHSLFAFPLALSGYFLANKEFDTVLLIKITMCFVFARTAGMGINRVIDRNIDAKNPRTSNRVIPTKRISLVKAKILIFISFLGFHIVAWFINNICFYLSFPASAMIILYSYGKRYTYACHMILGLIESCAPMGGYLAVTGKFAPAPVFFSLGVFFFFSGFDIIYSLLDVDFDIKNSLFSIASRFGTKKALNVSKAFHIISLLCFVCTGILLKKNYVYFIGMLIIAFLFYREHALAKTLKKENIEKAFFSTNAWISILLLIVTL